MIQKKSDDAISPVIGVMLMLVVTVVIAAAVTIFATGVVGETEAAPVAVLDVEIFNSVFALDGESHGAQNLVAPDLWITHVSGEPVDTRNIELRFSWECGVDDCEYGGVHYSTYSAEGFDNSGADVGRDQALAVKAQMDPQREYKYDIGPLRLDHFFGDVILTPGLKLTANADWLNLEQGKNIQSRFMEVIFNNYHSSIKPVYAEKTHNIPKGTEHDDCWECMLAEWGWGEPCAIGKSPEKLAELDAQKNAYANGQCYTCGHSIATCEADTEFNCACSGDDTSSPLIKHTGIMDHLQPGTAVDVMIIHTPSNKAIYDKTVIVQ